MKRYVYLATFAAFASLAASGVETAAGDRSNDQLLAPQIIYRGRLINGTNGKKAEFGDKKVVTNRVVFSVYDSDAASAPARWSCETNVLINAGDGSFEALIKGDERLFALVASGVVTHVGMALYSSGASPKRLPEITPRRALRPLAAVNRAAFAEGAAANIAIGTLEAKNLVGNLLAVESLEASVGVTGNQSQGVGVDRFTVAKDERTRVVGREIKMFNPPRRVATVENPVRGQVLWTATGNGTVFMHTTSTGNRTSLRIPGVVQMVRTGDVVRAPCTERGSVSVEYYPFAGDKGSEGGK